MKIVTWSSYCLLRIIISYLKPHYCLQTNYSHQTVIITCNHTITHNIYPQMQKSPFPGWRHTLLWHCSRCAARRHIAPYLFIICLDYVLRTSIDKMKDNGFKLTKERSRRYLAQTITGADYADDIAFLANIPAQAETLLHSLKRAAAGICLHVTAHKTEYMCFNQRGDISTLSGSSLKLVDKFTYLGSSVSSNETDINKRLAKAWTAIESLSLIWKSDLTDKIKRSFFSKQPSCRYCWMDTN